MSNDSYDIAKTLEDNYPFWDYLDQSQKADLISCSHIRRYSPGSFIHSRTEECLGVILVLAGQIRTYIQSEEGREVTLFRLGPEEVCTLSASCMMQEITFDIFIESIEGSTLLITTAACIHRLMEKNIHAENYIYRQTAERFSDVMWSMTNGWPRIWRMNRSNHTAAPFPPPMNRLPRTWALPGKWSPGCLNTLKRKDWCLLGGVPSP